MSSIETVGSAPARSRNSHNTASDDAPITHTIGRAIFAIELITGATNIASVSARWSAARLGTSSPRISDA